MKKIIKYAVAQLMKYLMYPINGFHKSINTMHVSSKSCKTFQLTSVMIFVRIFLAPVIFIQMFPWPYRSLVSENPIKKYTVTETLYSEWTDSTSTNTEISSSEEVENNKGSPQYQVKWLLWINSRF